MRCHRPASWRLFLAGMIVSQAVMLCSGGVAVAAANAQEAAPALINEDAIVVSLKTFIVAMLFNTGCTWGLAAWINRKVRYLERLAARSDKSEEAELP